VGAEDKGGSQWEKGGGGINYRTRREGRGRYRYWREEDQHEFRYNNKDAIQSNGTMCCNSSNNDLYVLVIYVIPNFQILINIFTLSNQLGEAHMIPTNQSNSHK
jgi:hypothetical protein